MAAATDPAPGARRRSAEARGRRAEALAVLRLRLAGWRILERRWRVPAGEVDLIARRGGILAFVEVKARAELAGALDAVTPAQQARIARAAAAYLAAGRPPPGLSPRFDIVVVRPGRWPLHLPGAFAVPDRLLCRMGW